MDQSSTTHPNGSRDRKIDFFKKMRNINKNLFFLIGFIFSAYNFSFGQTPIVIPLNSPNGGFHIDGDLRANTPTPGAGDWIPGATGGLNNGGSAFTSLGVPVNGVTSFRFIDPYKGGPGVDLGFNGGNKGNGNPNSWGWRAADVTPAPNDFNNVFYHLGNSTTPGFEGDWIILSADRDKTNGTSYLDFEFLQGNVERTGSGTSGGFTSDGPNGGRTIGDLLISVEYASGGSNPKIYAFRWKAVGTGFDYVLEGEITSPTFGLGVAYGAVNTTTLTDIQYLPFGNSFYEPRQWVEAAINVTKLFRAFSGDPCAGIAVKTIFIKSKASDAVTADIKDFIDPIPVSLAFGTAEISYSPDALCESTSSVLPSISGTEGGTFSATPAGLNINTSTGLITYAGSTPGTYTVSYSFNSAPSGATFSCPKTVQTTVRINPRTLVTNQPQGASYCLNASPQPLTVTGTGAGTISYEWFRTTTATNSGGTPVGSSQTFTPPTNAAGTYYYYALVKSSTCGNVASNSVTVQVNPLTEISNQPTGATYCQNATATPLTVIGTGTGTITYEWWQTTSAVNIGGTRVATTQNYTPPTNTEGTFYYYAKVISSSCNTVASNPVTVQVNALPAAPTSGGNISQCINSPAQTLTATASVPTGIEIRWFSAPTGGNLVANPTLNTLGTVTYYAEARNTITGCISPTRTPVTLTLLNCALTIDKVGTFVDQNNNGRADVGEKINYSFLVTNTGNSALTNVTVTDPKVTVTGGPISLAVGANSGNTFTGSYTITQNDINTGKVDNTAEAKGFFGTQFRTATDSETTNLPQRPALTIVKTGTFNDANNNSRADVG
ncbi:conserved repeat domain-containing protein, partial [Algoriphagus ornithinivorans]